MRHLQHNVNIFLVTLVLEEETTEFAYYHQGVLVKFEGPIWSHFYNVTENTFFRYPWAVLVRLRCYLWFQFIYKGSDMM